MRPRRQAIARVYFIFCVFLLLKSNFDWCLKNKKVNGYIFVVNSEGRKFSKNNWKFSETYCYLNQSKSLISDKHSRKYLKLSFKERLISSIKVWGY